MEWIRVDNVPVLERKRASSELEQHRLRAFYAWNVSHTVLAAFCVERDLIPRIIFADWRRCKLQIIQEKIASYTDGNQAVYCWVCCYLKERFYSYKAITNQYRCAWSFPRVKKVPSCQVKGLLREPFGSVHECKSIVLNADNTDTLSDRPWWLDVWWHIHHKSKACCLDLFS